MGQLHNLSLTPKIYKNAHKAFLMEKTIQNREGALGPDGELIVNTGKKTGRSAEDKYVVLNSDTKENIWWENHIHQMTPEKFNSLKNDVVKYLNTFDELYTTERSIGSKDFFSVGIEFVSPHPAAALFTEYIFKDHLENQHQDDFLILYAPEFKVDPKKYSTLSETIIVTCFESKTTIITGTKYAGEIKKSMFCVMNYLLPLKGILPMHSGANQNTNGDSFVFFGLSGTGKTTLSTDEGLQLIGDDEHGMSDKGLFNFEGGCYAKTSKLAFKTEPAIYKASTQFSSYLENVKLSDDRSAIDFFDESLTENGRATYPLSFISDRVESGEGNLPKHVFYLTADAFGVLPAVSLLTSLQAEEHFKLGYTAKLSGTEVGLKSPKATFSPCFGAPFMLRHLPVYSKLLKDFIQKHEIKVWLINTGWHAGSYGKGSRYPLSVTRSIIRAIQKNEVDYDNFQKDKYFDLNIPKSLAGLDLKTLDPLNSWEDKTEYEKVALQLVSDFKTHLVVQ
ncbi:MAG: phosphoenolpyruvate carboxykinase (ATP) [Rhizobacter sp.]|nr:phosphoenolpyruvate carboxykinase (ATP) [Bacteriovorax sp.]